LRNQVVEFVETFGRIFIIFFNNEMEKEGVRKKFE